MWEGGDPIVGEVKYLEWSAAAGLRHATFGLADAMSVALRSRPETAELGTRLQMTPPDI